MKTEIITISKEEILKLQLRDIHLNNGSLQRTVGTGTHKSKKNIEFRKRKHKNKFDF